MHCNCLESAITPPRSGERNEKILSFSLVLCVRPQVVKGQTLLWSPGAVVDLLRGSNCHLSLVKAVIASLPSCTQSPGSYQMSA